MSQIRRDRPRSLALVLVARDLVEPLERLPDVVEAVHQPVLDPRVDLEARDAARELDLLHLEIDRRLALGHDGAHVLLRQDHRKQADLGAVRVEDVGEAGRDDRAEAVVLQRPRRVLARGAAAEVPPGGQDRVARQHPPGLLGPVVEEELAEARALHSLEELLGDDLVGVDVGAVQDRDAAVDDGDRLHQLHSLMSTKWPSTAAAAAIWGETRWVRPPRPWRPSKLRFEVDAQRSPGWRMSGFIPRHIEQPAVRHSKPADLKTSSSPSSSASTFTCWEPGTTIPRTESATRRPSTIDAASRRSWIRELVQEPMKIRSRLMSVIGVPAVSPM